MRSLIIAILLLSVTYCSSAQDLSTFNFYNPKEDAVRAVDQAIVRAAAENKHVLIQVGGNWCIWCARFHALTKSDSLIRDFLQQHYVVYPLDYSKENRNPELMTRFRFPQRFGFPVFLVLDGKGHLLHTQNSEYLEEGKGYHPARVLDFLKQWSPPALNAQAYAHE